MTEDRLHALIVLLATVSIVSWSIVGLTTLMRLAAHLRYNRRAQLGKQQMKTEPSDAG